MENNSTIRSAREETGPYLDADEVHALRVALTRAGYTEDGIRAAMGPEVALGYRAADAPVYLRRLGAPGALNTLAKLFRIGVEISTDDAEEAFAPLSLDALARSGLVEVDDGVVRRRAVIKEADGLLFANDLVPEDAMTENWVMGVSPSSLTLASLSVRRPIACALDLGTGAGIQAIFTARHAERVVATDTNPRALAFARFNANLNGFDNIEFREGSWFEPVEGESFDLIVSNPPYVISPDSNFLYRDGGLDGDAVSRDVVRGAGTHLADDGFATILVNWAHTSDGDTYDAPRSWVAGIGCDAWILRSDTADLLSYAGQWNRDTASDAYATAIDRWMTYYEKLGIGSISTGAVILHKRPAPNWVSTYGGEAGGEGSSSDHIERIFTAETFLHDASDDDLLAASLRLFDEHTVSQRMTCRDGEWRVIDMQLRLGDGMHFEGALDAGGLHLLRLLDGSRTYGAAVAELAAELGTDADELRRATVPIVRMLLGLGFLEPTALPKTGAEE